MSDENTERTRKNLAFILKRLASVGQSKVAEMLQVHESTISRAKNGDLEFLAKLLAALNIKCVSTHAKCYEPKQIDAILQLARAGLNQIETVDDLKWEDDV